MAIVTQRRGAVKVLVGLRDMAAEALAQARAEQREAEEERRRERRAVLESLLVKRLSISRVDIRDTGRTDYVTVDDITFTCLPHRGERGELYLVQLCPDCGQLAVLTPIPNLATLGQRLEEGPTKMKCDQCRGY